MEIIGQIAESSGKISPLTDWNTNQNTYFSTNKLFIPSGYDCEMNPNLNPGFKLLIEHLQELHKPLELLEEEEYIPPAIILYRLETSEKTAKDLKKVMGALQVERVPENTFKQLEDTPRAKSYENM